MGVHMQSSLQDAMQIHDDESMDLVRDCAFAKAGMKTARSYAWNGGKSLDVVEIREPEITVHSPSKMPPLMRRRTLSTLPYTSMANTRKRRLSPSPDRVNKFPRLTNFMESCAHSPVECNVPVACPRSLQFALPGLSSRETQRLFGELESARCEISWLNGTRPEKSVLHPVFGWRTALWGLQTPTGNDMVVYKSAKAFEGLAVRDIAKRMWTWQGSLIGSSELGVRQTIYAVNEGIRIVRQRDGLHGRMRQTSLWIERICQQNESVAIVRKELHRFQDNIGGHRFTSDRECHGYILHPILAPIGAQIIAGTALHSIGSLRTRGDPYAKQAARMLEDMPLHVLQWEDCFLHSPST